MHQLENVSLTKFNSRLERLILHQHDMVRFADITEARADRPIHNRCDYVARGVAPVFSASVDVFKESM